MKIIYYAILVVIIVACGALTLAQVKNSNGTKSDINRPTSSEVAADLRVSKSLQGTANQAWENPGTGSFSSSSLPETPVSQSSKPNIESASAGEKENHNLSQEKRSPTSENDGQKFAFTSARAANSAFTNSVVQAGSKVQEPLAIQAVDSGAVALTGVQQAAIDAIAQNFVAAVGGENQNPNDRAYRQRWQTAQPASDDVMREAIGDSAYFQYVGAAAIQKLNEK